MTFSEAFKEGFAVVNRNWQLVVIQIAAMVVNLLGFILIVVVPVVIAVVYMGIDLGVFADAEHLPLSFAEIFSHYFGVFVVAVLLLLFYLVIVSVVVLLVYGGSSGVIARSVRDGQEKFSASRFFSEARRLFFPLMAYFTVVGFILIAALVLIAGVIVGSVALIGYLKDLSGLFGILVGLFLGLFIAAAVLFLATFLLAATAYGTAVLIFKAGKAYASFRQAVVFLYNRPTAYWLYCLLLLCSFGVMLVLTLIGLPFSYIPVFGMIIAVPYQVFTVIVQSYAGFVVTAVLFLYYYRNEITESPSMPESDSAPRQAAGQDPVPLQ